MSSFWFIIKNTEQYAAKKAKIGPAVMASYSIGNNIIISTARSQFNIVGIVINAGSTI